MRRCCREVGREGVGLLAVAVAVAGEGERAFRVKNRRAGEGDDAD